MRRILGLMMILALAACASEPDIRTDYDQSADFAAYRTFGFEEKLGTDAGGYSSLTTQRLKDAVTRELTARGYVAAAEPDLLVNFYARMEDKLRVAPAPPMLGPYYGYRRGFYDPWPGYGWGGPQVVDSYTQGTLNIDLIDRARRQLVWEGVAVGRVGSQDLADPQAAIDKAVGEIFAKYPFRAGG